MLELDTFVTEIFMSELPYSSSLPGSVASGAAALRTAAAATPLPLLVVHAGGGRVPLAAVVETSREAAVSQASALRKPVNNSVPLRKLKKQRQPRFRGEIPVVDDSLGSLARLAFAVFSVQHGTDGIPSTMRRNKSKPYIIRTPVHSISGLHGCTHESTLI
ncbi:hypothetical protein ABZP36_029675 [Zizania latifolia]